MNKKLKLTPSEKAIIRELIFVESFQHLREGTGLDYGTIRDDLITLINHQMVEVRDMEDGRTASPFYDADSIRHVSFQAPKSRLNRHQEPGNLNRSKTER